MEIIFKDHFRTPCIFSALGVEELYEQTLLISILLKRELRFKEVDNLMTEVPEFEART